MLELSYNFSTKFYDVNKFEGMELNTYLLYLALAEEELEDCIKSETRAQGQMLRSNGCVDSFTADALANFFPRTCFVKHKQHDKREPGILKEEFRCTEMLCLCGKTYCCYALPLIILNLAVKVSTNVYWNKAVTDHWNCIGES